MTLGGMVGIVSRSGGTHGIVQAMVRYARNRRRGQLATWLMGMLIFFDDYSNTLLVGNTMRPFTDRLRISREKLSYLVDSTAAPITSIALASTWIGFQLGLLDSSFSDLGISENAYVTFLMAIPYSFYSIMALLVVLVIAVSGRDFGPMLRAERRSMGEGKLLRDNAKPLLDQELANLMPPEGVKSRWYNAIVPIGTMILVLGMGLYTNGRAALGDGQHSLRLEYEYDDRREQYSGADTRFDTTRNYLTLNHVLRFGRDARSAWETLARFQDETGDLARDNAEVSTRLRLQHSS